MVQVSTIEQGNAVRVEWPDGRAARFHAIWLRDNAMDPETRDPRNGQRLIRLTDIPAESRVLEARGGEDGVVELEFSPDGKTVRYPADWLRAHIYERAHPRIPGWLPDRLRAWDARAADDMVNVDLHDARDDPEVLRAWLGAVSRFGFARMHGGQARGGALLEVVALFGFVRETNYGRWFEVRTEVDPVNLAYTGLGLQAHTDNPYRDPPPTLQILYCLENSAEGGDSRVVDGFRAAHTLREEAPENFDLLARHCARFEYAGTTGVCLRARRPIIELAPDGELCAVRFNNRSIAPLVDVPYAEMEAWYAAYRHFEEIIERPELSLTFKLAPGECFIVDNLRVLHAREAYRGAGTRWLQGCYPDRDGLLSTLASLERTRGGEIS